MAKELSRFPLQVLTYSAPANKSVGSSTTEILVASTSRKYLCIVNDSDEIIYLAFGASAVLNKGIRLNAAGGVCEIFGINICQQAVNGICASGSKNVTIQEAV